MGLLSEGSPLNWEDTQQYTEHVKRHGIAQLLNLFHKFKGLDDKKLLFGDELEYLLIKFDDENKKCKLVLKGGEVLEKLKRKVDSGEEEYADWAPEYASYMVESLPLKPYGEHLSDLKDVEPNLRKRRQKVTSALDCADETVCSMTVFPRLGCPGFTHPEVKPKPNGSITESLFFPDEAINGVHPRYKTFTQHLKNRIGEKIVINIPIFKDSKTPTPFKEDLPEADVTRAKPDHIYMDASGMGWGCCCLQTTFQASNIKDARYLYDQLTPLTPILMALSAASPIHRGYLSDIDHRWPVLSAAGDDRTLEEKGMKPLKNNKFLIPKSRFDSVDWYLSPQGMPHNDVKLVYDEEVYRRLCDGGIDEQLSAHFAHLYIRDPLLVLKENVYLDDKTENEHFENIQSSNWQSMRFKPPPDPTSSKIGWRVEFRPIESQWTDFENAAYTVFIALVIRVILSTNLNLLIPISKVEENKRRAVKRDAVNTEKFYFRKNIATSLDELESCKCTVPESCDCRVQQLTVDEIVNGKEGQFVGLLPLIDDYMESAETDSDTRQLISRYMNFISSRASGKLFTAARYMREFVRSHPLYGHDSVVSDKIAYDLMKRYVAIATGKQNCPEMLPPEATLK